MTDIGARIRITDHGDEHFGEYATVTVGEHPAVLTGRTMVEARVDGREWMYDIGLYLSQFEEVAELRVVA